MLNGQNIYLAIDKLSFERVPVLLQVSGAAIVSGPSICLYSAEMQIIDLALSPVCE